MRWNAKSDIDIDIVRASKHSSPNKRPGGYKSDAGIKEPSESMGEPTRDFDDDDALSFVIDVIRVYYCVAFSYSKVNKDTRWCSSAT